MLELIFGLSILSLFVLIWMIIDHFIQNPLKGKPEVPLSRRHLTVAEIRALNQQYAKKVAAEIASERGKVLAFKKKPWHSRSKKDH